MKTENEQLMCECADCEEVVPVFIECESTCPPGNSPYWADCPNCGVTGIGEFLSKCGSCGCLGDVFVPSESYMVERKIESILYMVDCDICKIYWKSDEMVQ